MVLDAEKDRPFMKDLLPLADYIICNRNFPLSFAGSRRVAIRSRKGRRLFPWYPSRIPFSRVQHMVASTGFRSEPYTTPSLHGRGI